MARARGANSQLALAFASAYGAIPASGSYFKLPFSTAELGEEQNLVESDLLGYGRDPQAPSYDVINNDGSATVPVDLRAFGYWLKMLFGAATATVGVAASGSVVFTANPANNATVTINGTVFTFKTSPAAATDIQIGTTLADTILNLVVALNASTDANVTPARYSADLAMTTLTVAHQTIGTAGNTFTLAASSSPASNGTPSGATLAGGSASGPTNHVFTSGALTLPDAAIELGFPDVPAYCMNYGAMVNTLSIPLQRSGHLNASLGLIAQGEVTASASSAVGALVEILLERFMQGAGQVYRDGVPLGEIVSGALNFSNGLDKVEVIRNDGRIAGVDPGMMAVTGQLVTRFSNTRLLDLATNKTPVELVFAWQISATKKLTIRVHNVYLPKPKKTVSGPAGLQLPFSFQAAEHPTAHKTLTATLVNDVTSY